MAGMTLLLGLALAAAPVQAPDAEVLARAEAEFQQGLRLRDRPDEARPHFREAARCYEILRAGGAHNADLYRNQGNAAFLAGDLPQAILAYRRGLHLAPHDSGLQTGLSHARTQVMYPPPGDFGRPGVEHWPPWLPRPSPRLQVGLAFLCYALACLALTRWLMTRGGWCLAGGVAALAGLAGLLTLCGFTEWQQQQERQTPLVVIAQDQVYLRKGNGRNFPPRYETPLNRGAEARLLFQRDDWLQVELSGGEVGWIHREQALVDAP